MRGLTSAMQSAIAGGTVTLALLFQASFTGGTVYAWTGIGNLSWNGQTWQGLGTLISFDQVDETDDVKAQSVILVVKGVSPGDISTALGQLANGQAGLIYLACFDAGGNLLASPRVIFRGRLDIGEIDDSNPDAPQINLTYEHELVDLERPREWRFTHQQQQQLYPGDNGLQYIAGLQDTEITWGQN